MITFTLSPNLRLDFFYDSFDSKIKTKLPSLKQHLFFVTNSEYLNVANNTSLSTNLVENFLIRTNSVVQYECGIKLPKSDDFQNELNSILDTLNIKGNCTKDFSRPGSYDSVYHLEHNYPKAIFSDSEDLMETKNYLTDNGNGFPKSIKVKDKEFVLHAIGIDYPDYNKPAKPVPNSKIPHIQIIYSDTSNRGYFKIKKSDNNSNVNELSEHPEFDAIYVNIHFYESNNKSYKHWEDQLKTIANQFKLVTCSDNIDYDLVKINGCKIKLNNHFKNLEALFKELCEISFDQSFSTTKELDDVCTKIGQTKSSTSEVKFYNGDTKVTKGFSSLSISNEKFLYVSKQLPTILESQTQNSIEDIIPLEVLSLDEQNTEIVGDNK